LAASNSQEVVQVLDVDSYEDIEQLYFAPFATVSLLVRNVRAEQEVGILIQMKDEMTLVPAFYEGAANEGSSVWKAEIPILPGPQLEFLTLFKTPEGSILGDQQGRPYVFDYRMGVALYSCFVKNKSLMETRHYNRNGDEKHWIDFTVAVKNIAMNKAVEVIYFFNGGREDRTLALAFSSMPQLINPDGTFEIADTEIWSGHLVFPQDVEEVLYYVRYTVGGQVYLDTNYGLYYLVRRQAN
jgi:hypothetical protein